MGIRGVGALLGSCVVLRVLAVDCCSLGRVEGPLMSSGKRNECILADCRAIENIYYLRTRLS